MPARQKAARRLPKRDAGHQACPFLRPPGAPNRHTTNPASLNVLKYWSREHRWQGRVAAHDAQVAAVVQARTAEHEVEQRLGPRRVGARNDRPQRWHWTVDVPPAEPNQSRETPEGKVGDRQYRPAHQRASARASRVRCDSFASSIFKARRACRVIGQNRSSQRKRPVVGADEDALTAAIIWLACTYGRHGYRRVTALLRNAGWHVNHKRVARPKPASGFSHRTWSFGVLLDRHRK